MRRVILPAKTLAAAVANNICLAQTPAAGGVQALNINGAAAAGGVATLDTQRQVLITSAGNDAARTFTLTGTDDNGNTISESITPGPNPTVASALHYKTVTKVTVDGNTAGAITVGTNGVGASVPVVLDQYVTPFSVDLSVNDTGGANYTVQYTEDDIFGNQSVLNWRNVPGLVAQVAGTDGLLSGPASAVRVVLNAVGGSVVLTVRQAGGGGIS